MFNLAKRRDRMGFIKVFGTSIVVAIIYEIILTPIKQGSILGIILGTGLVLYAIFLAVLWFCISKQRANDISGEYAILVFILFGLTPLFLLYAIIPGENRTNKYGPQPLN
jgi:uncharacterized membrane protein YhaH (DUF805 family)